MPKTWPLCPGMVTFKDHDIYKRIVWRPKHDYFLYINENNEVEAHEM